MAKQLFFSKNEVFVTLGISLPTLNRRLADGSLGFVKLGARVLIPASEIERLLEAADARQEA